MIERLRTWLERILPAAVVWALIILGMVTGLGIAAFVYVEVHMGG